MIKINFKELSGSNTELDLYTVSVVELTSEHDKNTEVIKAPSNTLEIKIQDQSALQSHVKISGVTAGTIKVSFSGGNNSLFFQGLQGNNIYITDTSHSIDWSNLPAQGPGN